MPFFSEGQQTPQTLRYIAEELARTASRLQAVAAVMEQHEVEIAVVKGVRELERGMRGVSNFGKYASDAVRDTMWKSGFFDASETEKSEPDTPTSCEGKPKSEPPNTSPIKPKNT